MKLILVLAAAVLAGALTACAGTSDPGAGARSRSGVEAFGVIDVGVSRTTNKSEPAR